MSLCLYSGMKVGGKRKLVVPAKMGLVHCLSVVLLLSDALSVDNSLSAANVKIYDMHYDRVIKMLLDIPLKCREILH